MPGLLYSFICDIPLTSDSANRPLLTTRRNTQKEGGPAKLWNRKTYPMADGSSAVLPSTPPPPAPVPLLASPAASPSPAVLRTLFVYGPLMAEEAVNALIGRTPTMRTATLAGHVRCCKRGAEELTGVCSTHRSLVRAGYPAATPTGADADGVEGVLLERLRPQELQILDFYEDDTYMREVVRVRTAGGFGAEEEVMAFAYVWPAKQVSALDLKAPWQYTEFRTKNMKAFIEQIIKPCRKAFEKEQGALEAQMSQRESARSHRAATPAAAASALS